jgi:hypothetical protein
MKLNMPTSNNAMKTNFVILELISGHLAHLAVPVSEYPPLHSAQSTPVYPSAHYPIGFHVGATQPKHTSGLGHLIKFALELEGRQYPGFGPMSLPPVHDAFSESHGLQSPGSFIATREKPWFGSHQMHLPTALKYSPTLHSLRPTSSSKSICSTSNFSLNSLFSGKASSMAEDMKFNL